MNNTPVKILPVFTCRAKLPTRYFKISSDFLSDA